MDRSGLLAAIFLFAGGMKLVIPIEEMTEADADTAAGVVPPFHRHRRGARRDRSNPPLAPAHTAGLTPLAAAGLVIVMIGATVYNLAAGDVASALITLVVGLLCAFVAYGRWRLTPPSTRS